MAEDQTQQTGPPRRARRSGGRSARRAARAEHVHGSAVRPGQASGHYKPLRPEDIQRIHDTSPHILESFGIGDLIPENPQCALPGGRTLGDDDRLHYRRVLVEDGRW